MAPAVRDADAIAHLTKAVAYDATSSARLALADPRGQGRAADSLPHYAEALRLDPQSADARFGPWPALVRLRRYAQPARVEGRTRHRIGRRRDAWRASLRCARPSRPRRCRAYALANEL